MSDEEESPPKKAKINGAEKLIGPGRGRGLTIESKIEI